MSPLALRTLLAAGLMALAPVAEAYPVVIAPVTAHGARLSGETGALRLVTAFEPGATAYGPAFSWRSEGGFLLGLGVYPGHRPSGPRRLELGLAGHLELGVALPFSSTSLGEANLRFGGALRAFGQLGTGALESRLGGAALTLTAALEGHEPSGLESLQLFTEYRPVIFSQLEPRERLHGLRVGLALVFDASSVPGLDTGLLLGAALDVRSVERDEGLGMTVDLGLAF